MLFLLLIPVAHAWVDAPVSVSLTPPPGAACIVSPYINYAIEFNSFHYFSGDDEAGPNNFSYNLLSNIGNISGTMPYVRVGGSSQDKMVYNSSQSEAIINVYNGSAPKSTTIGPLFYTGFNQWPGVRFINGLNQCTSNSTMGFTNLLAEVNASCTTVKPENLFAWEYGNEADLYAHNGCRPPTYNEADYVNDWINGTAIVRNQINAVCPGYPIDFVSPGFGLYGLPYSNLDPIIVAQDGIDHYNDIREWSLHLYMGGTSIGPTLQGTLMNHTNIARVLSARTGLAEELKSIVDLPFAITEENSILNVGVPGLTDVFGAALWAMDFQLWAAQSGAINRIHVQMGYEFPYASWSPVNATGRPVAGFPTDDFPIATNAPYYGDISSATALGDATHNDVKIASVPIGNNETESGYAVYENGSLARLVAINLMAWNASGVRPNETYSFDVGNCQGTVARLTSNSSNDKSGITLNGYSYDYDLAEGKPVKVGPSDESIESSDGVLQVVVPHSSAAIVSLLC